MYKPQKINKNDAIVEKDVNKYGFLFFKIVVLKVKITPHNIIGVINMCRDMLSKNMKKYAMPKLIISGKNL